MGAIDERDEMTIAIVGMTVRAPGAHGVARFWENLVGGVESVERFGQERREASPFHAVGSSEAWVGAAGVLADADLFDAEFFGYPPRDAALLDPQQRVFLECAWEALEDAGYDPARAPTIGVFAGAGANSYVFNVVSNAAFAAHVAPHQMLVSQEKDFLATRVSYHLGLRGPSVTIQTACSTSLVAVHVACQSLLARECDIAIAGGVSIAAAQRAGYVPLRGAILAPDGRCRAFDAGAAGTVPGNGAGAVVLKRYADALRDGDTIHARILGSAISNDGDAKGSYVAPSAEGQAAAIAEALAVAGVDSRSIGYVEAHGTGTQLGDPIEVAALAKVFARDRRTPCLLGSVKTNLGHLDAASGVVGLIKATLAVREGLIPPTLHFTSPNPKLELERTPFAVVSRLTEWREPEAPRRAGVSSFGLGGTNAHVVLEQAGVGVAGVPRRPESWVVLPLSGRSAAALTAGAARLHDRLDGPGAPHLDDVARTLSVGRRAFPLRRAIVARDRADAIAQLAVAPAATARAVPKTAPRVAFLFPGQGSQCSRMGAELAAIGPVFHASLEACAALLAARAGVDLRAALAGDEETLRHTALAQPAIFSVSWALARQLEAWGVTAVSMVGHSVGEYVAACLAGVFSFEDALLLVVDRGRLMGELPPGVMLAVAAASDEVMPWLVAPGAVAAENAPGSCVVSGPADAIAATERALRDRGIASRRLATSHAFHGPSVDPILPRFAERVRKVVLRAPSRPFVSTVTGRLAAASEVTSADYWVGQIRRPVLFSAALLAASAEATVFLEVGPGRALSGLAQRQLPYDTHHALSVLAAPEEARSALGALARLWELGADVPWDRLVDGEARRVSLPAYPFERKRYWIPFTATAQASALHDSGGAEQAAPETLGAELVERTLDEHFVAPRSDTERELAAVWCALLGVREVGVRDDFFALRGDSLLATQLVVRIRSRFGVDLPLRAIFETPTIEALAERLDALPRGALALPPIARRALATGAPLSAAQQRLWFLDRMHPGSSAYNLTFAVRARGPLDRGALERAVAEIVRRHEALRTVIVDDDGKPRGVLMDPAPVVLALEQVEGIDAARRLVDAESRVPFDLARGPLLRSRAITVDERDHVVSFSVHHVAFDVWSCAVFVRELLALYEAYVAGRPSPLPELEVQYADYAEWQRTHLTDELCAREVAHWRTVLGAEPPRVTLPPDRDVVPTTSAGASCVARVDDVMTSRLRDLARASGTTLFAVLMGAYAALLQWRSGVSDLVIGTDVANRTRVEIEPLVGFFVNQVTVRVDLADRPAMSQVVARVHAAAVTAFAHQDVPFDRVVAGLAPSRAERRAPLFDAKFVLRNVRFPELRAGGAVFEVLDVERRSTAFDFVMTCADADHGLRLEVEYSTERYDAPSIREFLADYEAMLRAMTERYEATTAALCAEVDEAARARRATAAARAKGVASERLRALGRTSKAATAGSPEER